MAAQLWYCPRLHLLHKPWWDSTLYWVACLDSTTECMYTILYVLCRHLIDWKVQIYSNSPFNINANVFGRFYCFSQFIENVQNENTTWHFFFKLGLGTANVIFSFIKGMSDSQGYLIQNILIYFINDFLSWKVLWQFRSLFLQHNPQVPFIKKSQLKIANFQLEKNIYNLFIFEKRQSLKST